ncbi:MAG: PAS domain S-box protein [Chloroflexi bacterium]|nr:PAS domain S-box protein [Chloroflexota bacterium]
MTSFFPMAKVAPRLAEVCSLATLCMAGLALLSWSLDHWQLWAFGGGYVPMAPSTALALLLLNSAVLLRNRWPDQPVTLRWSFLAAAVVAWFGLLVLLQKPAGFELPVEKWLARTSDTVGNIPVGRMSPLTAFTFLLAAGALFFGLPPFRHRRLCSYAGHALALLVLLTGVVFVLGYAAGTPLWYGGLTIPMALLTAISFLLTGLGLLAVGLGSRLRHLQDESWLWPTPHASRRFGWFLLAAFVALAAAIGTAGFFGLRRQHAHARQTMQEELAAIADLKVGQIVNWRNERRAGARFFSKAPMLARDVQSFLADPSSEAARAETLAWLRLLKAGDRYAQVVLFDSNLDPRLSVPPRTNEPGAWLRAQVATMFLTNEVVMTDLRREETSRDIRLDIFFPVFAPATPDVLPALAGQRSTVSPLAVILLRLDPRQFLYPLVQSWPTPSRSAETVLVRREGDELVFLNELRHRTNTALNLRFPVAEPVLPAAIALREQEGVVEGRDYRAVPVLTAFRPVPDSPWFLGAKVDRAEIYRPLRRQALAVGSIVAVLLVAVALGTGLIWPQRDAVLLSHELASERERKALAERFAHLMQNANDAILLTDETWRILEANERALQTYGYSLSELQQMHLPDLRTPEARAGFACDFERLREQGSAVFETMHRRKDGGAFPVENSARIVEIAGVNYKLAILRDITERKRYESRLQQLVEVIQKLAAARDLDSIMAAVRSAARRLTGADGATFVLREGDQCHYADEDAFTEKKRLNHTIL